MATDVLFERAMEFAKHKRQSAGMSNIYVMQTIDRDGNITSETYGMNTFTNYGFEQFFNSNVTWPRYMYIGQGGDEDNPNFLTSPQLIDPITTSRDNDSLRNTTIDYKYPMYYDATSGIISCVCKFQTSTFGNSTDYGIDGVSTDVSISEYGIGTAWNALWTHSWVYDLQGARCTVTKHLNEQLIITVYFCMSYNESLITDGWNDNRYVVITTLEKFLNTRNSNVNMTESNAGIFKRNNTVNSFNRTFSRSLYTNNQITLHTNLEEFTMLNQTGTAHGYLDGFYNYTPGFVIVEPQQLSTPESFDFIIQNRYDNFSATSMAVYIGEDAGSGTDGGFKVPFTQMDLQHVYLYNKNTKEYNNPLPFTNSSTRWYGESAMENNLRVPIYYTNKDEYIEAFVHQNLRTDDAILGFDNSDISTIYGTNKYWDRSTWIEISTRSSIPQSVRNMRYYITNNSTSSLKPIRESGDLTLTPSTGIDRTLPWLIRDYYSWTYEHCNNIDRGYFVIDNKAFIPSNSVVFTIGSNIGTTLNSGTQSNVHFCYNNRIISIDSRSSYYVTNMDDLNNVYSVIVPTTGSDGFGDTEVNLLTQAYRTETSNGTLCFQALNVNKCLVIDTTRTSPSSENSLYHIPFDSYMACAIYSTANKNYVAYISTDDTPVLKVYNVSTDIEYKSITLPEGIYNTATLMFGLNGYVWITNCSSYCYQFDIENETYKNCIIDQFTLVQNKSDLRYVRMTAVDDVMVIYRNNLVSLQYGYYVRIDETLQNPIVYNLRDFYTSTDYQSAVINYHLAYVENNTLLLLVQAGYHQGTTTEIGCCRHIIDFGQWLNPPDDVEGRVKKDLYKCSNGDDPWYPYGKNVVWRNKIIPMAYLLPMRWVGTTKTHSTVNNMKHVSGKQWSMTVSNIAPTNFGDTGFPPGVQN